MQSRVRAVQIVIAAWACLVFWFLVSFKISELNGQTQVYGMDRLLALVIWQGVAAVVAVAAWQLGRSLPEDLRLRSYSRMPLAGFVLVLSTVVGLSVVSVFAGGTKYSSISPADSRMEPIWMDTERAF